ncbi:MAG TPA: Cof-type HAD-IIB family hydrolase [Pyrinomonadaceae bacterium]|nr:Cof-type HAD-IIB family hydrolase [Pyrinomonadaceae bacterium]
MKIRLIALDLDGTLLDSRGQISERNRRALSEARSKGARVALVTGRRFRDARPLALELGLDVPVIAHNGALTKHARTLETVAALLLERGAARDVVRLGRERGADPLVSDDHEGQGVLVYETLNEDNLSLVKYVAWARRIHGEGAEESVRRVEALEDYLDHDPVHVGFSGTCAAVKSLSEEVAREMGGRVKQFLTLYPKRDFALLDVVNPLASKGAGLAAVASEYGLAREEVMAIGDNLNDVEMLEYAGTGVVMANAEAPLRARPEFHTTAANDEDGVAVAIERFVLEQMDGEETNG